MKKSVVILIGIIYVASIVVVTFFGLKHNVFFDDIKVKEVKITNEGIRYSAQNEKYVVLDSGTNTFQIEYEVYPDNAINKEVEFVIDNPPAGVSVDQSGLVTIDAEYTSVIVYVISKDGDNAWDKIEVTRFK